MSAETLMNTTITTLCTTAREASYQLAKCTTDQKNTALQKIAEQLLQDQESILLEHKKDLDIAKKKQQTAAFIDRMTLTPERFQTMVASVRAIAALPDPVGVELAHWQVDSGLDITRVSVPLGVIAVIYESRPNVTVDAAALCLKSGNAVILRGGSECVHTNRALVASIQAALHETSTIDTAIQMIPDQDRAWSDALLQQHQLIDVVIPRGGEQLIEHIRTHSRIPVFSHLSGLCHTYIHGAAHLGKAVAIVVNAKMRRPSICGATETLLIDQAIAQAFLPDIAQALITAGCALRGDAHICELDQRIQPATDSDWATEYLAPTLSIKTVSDLQEAMQHIQQYGSHHTDAIITEDAAVAEKFLKTVDSAIVMHNASTQFADGGEFGLGAEIGIATGRLHARGPVGLAQLNTFKYQVRGTGQVRPV